MKQKRSNPVNLAVSIWRRETMMQLFKQIALNRSLPLWSRVVAGRAMIVVILRRLRFQERIFREMENKP